MEIEAELGESEARTNKMAWGYDTELRKAEARTNEMARKSQFEPRNLYETFESK